MTLVVHKRYVLKIFGSFFGWMSRVVGSWFMAERMDSSCCCWWSRSGRPSDPRLSCPLEGAEILCACNWDGWGYFNLPSKLPLCHTHMPVELTFWGRPSAGNAFRRVRRRRVCSQSACACAWWGWRTGWTPCRTPRTCVVFRLKNGI